MINFQSLTLDQETILEEITHLATKLAVQMEYLPDQVIHQSIKSLITELANRADSELSIRAEDCGGMEYNPTARPVVTIDDFFDYLNDESYLADDPTEPIQLPQIDEDSDGPTKPIEPYIEDEDDDSPTEQNRPFFFEDDWDDDAETS